jgi:hypothetical protein
MSLESVEGGMSCETYVESIFCEDLCCSAVDKP